jgi:hypothetical protein
MTRCPKLQWSQCQRTSKRDCAALAKACERTNWRHSGGEPVGQRGRPLNQRKVVGTVPDKSATVG